MGCYRAASEAGVVGQGPLLQFLGRRRDGGCKAAMGLDWCGVVPSLLTGKGLGSCPVCFGGNSWGFPCVPVRSAPGDGVRDVWVGYDPAWPPFLSALLLLSKSIQANK